MTKLITVIIKPFKLDEVKTALTAAGVGGMTITQVRGFGRQAGHTEYYRGAEYPVDEVPKLKLEILAEDGHVQPIVEAAVASARNGKIGDGKVWVTDVEGVVRIRTGDTGDAAI